MTDISKSLVSISTRFIRVLTDEFPLTLFDIRRAHRDVMWGTEISEEFIHELGYAIIQSRPPVEAGNFIEVAPTLEDGLYFQNWVLREETSAEIDSRFHSAQDSAEAIVKAMSSQSLERGVAFNFGSEEAPVIRSVQCRTVDRLNVMGMCEKAKRVPDATQFFRTGENEMFNVSPEMLIAISGATYDGYTAVKAAEWALLDPIRKATNLSEIPAVPETLRQFYETNAGLTWLEQTA